MPSIWLPESDYDPQHQCLPKIEVGMCVCLLLQDLVQSCLRGEGGILEDMGRRMVTRPKRTKSDCPTTSPETGVQPSLSSGLCDTPCLNRQTMGPSIVECVLCVCLLLQDLVQSCLRGGMCVCFYYST